MILRRLTQNVKDQNWTAIGIELLIVVLGVFLGIQFSNWNDARVDKIRARDYLERIDANLDADIADIQQRKEIWSQVADYGALGLHYAETREIEDHTFWQLLLAYFQASQVAELIPAQATYDELKSAGELGLITNLDFRNALTSYYNFAAAASVTERPPYREHIRSVIPIDVQRYIWDSCYRSDGSGKQEMFDCPSPIDDARAAAIVEAIADNLTLMDELRYWMSSMHVAGLIGRNRMEIASALRATIDQELGNP